jgi:hypothetical protein
MSTMLNLQKGDILLNQDDIDKYHDYAHAILFVGWVDTQQKQIVSKPVIAKDGYYYYDGIEENGGIEKHTDGTYSGYAIEHLPNYPVDTQSFNFNQPWPFPYDVSEDPGGYYAWWFDPAKAAQLGYISQSGITTPIASATATTKPSGEWMPPTPKDRALLTSDVILLAATAYPTHQKDPAIVQVFFTIESNGNWRIVCSPTKSSKSGSVYTCDVNLKDLRVPYGQIRVSFDVYDQAGNVNPSSNGEHTLTYVPLPKLEVNPASIDNLTLGNSDCTSTPISSTCLMVLSSPSSNQLNIKMMVSRRKQDGVSFVRLVAAQSHV